MDDKITDGKEFLGKKVKIKIDRPLNSKHPKYSWLYELNYGFVPNTMSPDGEELDAYLIGINVPLKDFEGFCVAIIHRLNDEDDKLVIVTEDKIGISDDEILNLTHFQEQWFNSVIIRKE